MNEKRGNFFLHDWKTDKRFMIQLRKKKRTEIQYKKRFLDYEKSKVKPVESVEILEKLRDLCNASDDNAKIICLELLENKEILLGCEKAETLDIILKAFDKYSLETTGLLFELLMELNFRELGRVYEILNSNLLSYNIEFLYKLCILGQIDFLLVPDTLKLILNTAASIASPDQLKSLQLIREILYSSEENTTFLIEIGVLELFQALLGFNSIPNLKELLLSLSHLILGPVSQLSKILALSIPQLLTYLPTLYLPLSPEIDEFLNLSIQTCKFHSLMSEFYSVITPNIYPILQEILINYPKHLSPDFLSFLTNLLTPDLPDEHFESFTSSGCYNALEYCAVQSPEPVSSVIQEILSFHFA